MARKLRASAASVPEHIIQRGNNRQVVFCNEEDIKACVTWLKQYAKEYKVPIHS
jgi:putative transposase